MARTTQSQVEGVLLADYDSDAEHDLTPFIDAASLMVDGLDACAQTKGIIYTESELTHIETWIAAHGYKQSDPAWDEVRTGDAAGKRQGKTEMYLESTLYGQMAITLDRSGCLKDLQADVDADPETSVTIDATGMWIGKTRSQRRSIWERNQ